MNLSDLYVVVIRDIIGDTRQEQDDQEKGVCEDPLGVYASADIAEKHEMRQWSNVEDIGEIPLKVTRSCRFQVLCRAGMEQPSFGPAMTAPGNISEGRKRHSEEGSR